MHFHLHWGVIAGAVCWILIVQMQPIFLKEREDAPHRLNQIDQCVLQMCTAGRTWKQRRSSFGGHTGLWSKMSGRLGQVVEVHPTARKEGQKVNVDYWKSVLIKWVSLWHVWQANRIQIEETAIAVHICRSVISGPHACQFHLAASRRNCWMLAWFCTTSSHSMTISNIYSSPQTWINKWGTLLLSLLGYYDDCDDDYNFNCNCKYHSHLYYYCCCCCYYWHYYHHSHRYSFSHFLLLVLVFLIFFLLWLWLFLFFLFMLSLLLLLLLFLFLDYY